MKQRCFVKAAAWTAGLWCICVPFSSARAADGVWIGTSDGNWSDTANWRDGVYASGAGSTAYFTNGAAVTVTQDLGSLTLGNIYVANASVSITNNAISLPAGTSSITVDGSSVTATVNVALSAATGVTLAKAGTGTLLFNKSAGTFSAVALNGGTTLLGPGVGGDGFGVNTNTITVGAGATLRYLDNNLINNYAVLDIKSGGVLDFKGLSDNIGAITGDGVVSNFTWQAQFWLNGMTRKFSGLIYGNGTLWFMQQGVFVDGGSNTLQTVTFRLDFSNNLAFVPGVGTFYVGQLTDTNRQAVALQDTAGGPITLALGARNDSYTLLPDLTGNGGLMKVGSGTLTLTNALAYSGDTIINAGVLKIGDGVNDGAITNSSGIMLDASGTLAFNTLSNQTVVAPITGAGYLTKAQSSAVALNAYSMSNGTVTVNGGALSVGGGNYLRGSFTANAGTQLSFDGGSGTGATLTVSTINPIRITGGTHQFASTIGKNNARYEQTGGVSQFLGTDGYLNTNSIFVILSGGTLRVLANDTYLSRGIGLYACSNATVVMHEGNSYHQRIASDGASHEIVVTNNASVSSDTFQIMSIGANTASTGTLTLAGGTVTVRSIDNSQANSNSFNFINFNGGLLKFTSGMAIVANASATFRVFSGGARIDGGSYQTQINQPLVSAQDGLYDGGLTKYGASVLVLPTNATYTGQTTAKAGTLRTTSSGGAPFGTGSVLVNGGTLQAQPAGSGGAVALTAASADSSRTVAYGPGPSTLSFSKMSDSSVSLTLGSGDADAYSVLVRTNGGVLAVSPANGTAAANLGANEKVLVNGGVAMVNGMVSPAVAGIGSDTYKSVDFLAYDGTSGFVLPAYTDGLSGGSASLANVASSTSSDSAQVYALRVSGGATLTLNSGATLTVGDGANPAGVILNNSASSRAVITNGTLDFGTSEGIVWFGQNMGSSGARISSAITGAGGLTLVGGGANEGLSLDSPSGNAYAGGTRIMAGRVDIANRRGFGDGDVYIYGNEGWGGQFLFTIADTVTNAFHLAGIGPTESPYMGAVRFNTSTALSGPIELMDDARVGAYTLKTGTISGPISGVGGLEISGTLTSFVWGQIVLGGVNTYAGSTKINCGTLVIAPGGTLGQGPVVDNATLKINTDSDVTVTNTFSGTGRIVKNGAGQLTLTDVGSFSGSIQVDGGAVSVGDTMASLGVNGAMVVGCTNLSIAHLSGTGTVIAASGEVTLTVGADNSDSQYRGTITDGLGTVSLLKTGSGTLTLEGQSTYSGPTVIGSGTLKLQAVPTPLATGLAYQLDATKASSLTLDGSNVTVWADVSGSGVTFTQALSAAQPVLLTNAINGLAAVNFNGAMSNRMATAKTVNAQTVFVVNALTSYMSLGGIWGRSGADAGLRVDSSTTWQMDSFAANGQVFVNGVETNKFVYGSPHIVAASSFAQNTGWATAIGDYWGSVGGYHRSYGGLIGELLVYDSYLSASDRQTVEAYLAYKWFGIGNYTVSNVLSTSTALSISNNAAFDLNGVNQTVASLTGAGVVTNSSGVWDTLTVGDGSDATFSGVIAGSNAVVKTGSGTLTLSGANTYLGNTAVNAGTLLLAGGANRLPVGGTVTVASGATLDLNGQSQTLYGIAGRGTVAGGNLLTVTGVVSPGGDGSVGTLTLEGSPALAGTLLMDTRRDGTCDLLDVTGDLDLSALSLQIADTSLMAGISYTIAACSGTLTGSFASSNLTKAWSIRYDRTVGAGSVMLVHNLGTAILVK